MTTNGVLLPKMAADLKEAGLSRVNISLDTLDPAQFRQMTRRGELQQTLDGIDAALAAGFNPVKINAVAVRSLDQDYLAFAKCPHPSPAARAVHRVHARGRELRQPRPRLGQGRRRAQRGAVRDHQRARPRRRDGRAGAGRQRPPARVGARALLRVPERAGHGGLHQPAVASLLQRMQPPAADGRRQAAPVPVLGRRVRRAHCVARRRRPGGARRVRRGFGCEARRAPRQSRHRTQHVANRRARFRLPTASGTCRRCAEEQVPEGGRRDEACRLRAIPRARVPKYASPLRSPEFDAPRPFSPTHCANLRSFNLQDTEPRRYP